MNLRLPTNQTEADRLLAAWPKVEESLAAKPFRPVSGDMTGQYERGVNRWSSVKRRAEWAK